MPWSQSQDYSTGYRRSHMDVPVKDSTPYRLSVNQVSGSGPRGGHTWSVSLGPHEANEDGRYWTPITSGSAQSMPDAKRAARAAMLQHRSGGDEGSSITTNLVGTKMLKNQHGTIYWNPKAEGG